MPCGPATDAVTVASSPVTAQPSIVAPLAATTRAA